MHNRGIVCRYGRRLHSLNDICLGARPRRPYLHGILNMQENIPLSSFTTLRAGGPARYFCVAGNTEELRAAVQFAKEKEQPLFVLGGGSNVLVSDEGFSGVVIKNEIKGARYEDAGNGCVRVAAGAGENWDELVSDTVACDLYGLENLSSIPGTVGAVPIQNVNAYGAHAQDTIESVEVFDADTEQIHTLTNNECKFAYRDSVFKSQKNLIVTRVAFLLEKNGNVNYEYKDLQKHFARKNIKRPTLAEVREAVVTIRRGKLPRIEEVGTAGSFFMHPVVAAEEAEKLKKVFPDALTVPYELGKEKIISGRLLDILGWKNVAEGGVGTHHTHALTIVNHGENNAREVYEFAQKMRHDVKEKTGIDLEFETQLIGKF